MIFAAEYLLIGLVVSFLLESVIRWADQDVTNLERGMMIFAWPIMGAIFVIYFIKGLLNDD